ncbi:MAG TPA: hypothetical protein PLG38_00695 [Propionibacteriaceae bacterium]|nr:hypothetical protein [Propionibacteriaceae bacterium]
MSMPWRRTLAIDLAYRVARGHTDCPTTDAALEAAEVWSRTAGRSLPAELVELWRVVAGVDFNGSVLFGPVERPEPGN